MPRAKGKDFIRSMAEIGRRLELGRNAIGLDQSKYSRMAGVSQNTYNQYERGKSRPSLNHAFMLCDTHGLTLDWVYNGDASGLPPDLQAAIRTLQTLRHR
jgi:DNA-binding XRE family transcriptional regulator